MGRLIKFLFLVVVLIALAVVGYAFFGDLSAPQSEVSTPVVLDAD